MLPLPLDVTSELFEMNNTSESPIEFFLFLCTSSTGPILS